MAKPKKPKKPNKPSDDFPLFAHANGQWAKKIRGKMYYFGPWGEADEARRKYLIDKDRLQAGLPRSAESTADNEKVSNSATTMVRLVNDFLNAKRRRLKTGELAHRTHNDYYTHCELLLDLVGRQTIIETLTAEDFDTLRDAMATGVGLVSLANRVRMTRMLFKFAYDTDLIEKPLKFGPGFKLPSKKAMRIHRNSKPLRMFEANELRDIISGARGTLNAMILLGINCGFGQTDCSNLPRAAIDLDKGWIDFPRPKTGINRRCPLWPETIKALKDALAKRPKAKRPDFDELAFLTVRGVPFVRTGSTGSVIDGVAQEFRKLLIDLKLSGNRRAFYALRHTFETIGGDSRDQVAVDFIMGHAPDSDDMSAEYRERVFDGRLIDVVNYVHTWLWPRSRAKVKKPTK